MNICQVNAPGANFALLYGLSLMSVFLYLEEVWKTVNPILATGKLLFRGNLSPCEQNIKYIPGEE